MTNDPYGILGLPAHEDVTDEAVRQRYLQLLREYPPEQQPVKFAAIRAAYEKIRTLPARAKYRLFEAGSEDTLDQILEEVVCAMPRPRPTLMQLIDATEGAKSP